MQEYICLLPIPENAYADLVEKAAGAQWAIAPDAEDPGGDAGVVPLVGMFADDATALEEFERAFADYIPREGSDAFDLVNLVGRQNVAQLLVGKDTIGLLRPPTSPDTGDDREPDTPGPPVADPVSDDSQPEPSGDRAAARKPATRRTDTSPLAAPVQSELAQTIAAGLPAIGTASRLWMYVRSPTRAELAEKVLTELHAGRTSYAEDVAWTFAAERRMLAALDDSDRRALIKSMLEVRNGLATHQLALAEQDVEHRKIDAALRTELTEAEKTRNELFKEVVAQVKTWTALASWGKWLLVAGVVFAMIVSLWLTKLARDDKIDDWMLPVGIFALALFAVSPAVLLLLERPLKGIDEWKPGGAHDRSASSTAGADGNRAQAVSTASYGQTNAPKAYGPDGSLRT